MTNIFLFIAIALIVVTGILIVLIRTKVLVIKSKPIVATLYSLLTISVIYIVLTLGGSPLLDKINAYQQKVLSESEEECKRDDAPFWCNL